MSGRFNSISMQRLFLGTFTAIWAILLLADVSPAARIKDITSIKGVRANQLFGYGLVIGLNGSGDKGGTKFTIQGLANMLEKMGVHVSAGDVMVSNVAAVVVSSVLPPFARIGSRIDVTISSIGDAKSLQGGTLLLTPLKGVDGKIYALTQGPISIGGFTAGGASGGGVTKNHPTVGRISGGATVEREVQVSLNGKNHLTMLLNHPDFITVTRVAGAINNRFGEELAHPVDSGTLQIKIPDVYRQRVVNMLADLEELDVTPDTRAKVLVSEKTGTVVIGENVRILTVAVAHGNLSIQISEKPTVSQANPFAPGAAAGAGASQMDNGVVVAPGGSTVVTPQSDVSIDEEKSRLLLVPKGSSIGDLVRGLNAIGVSPRDLITILQTMKAAGALQAEIEIL